MAGRILLGLAQVAVAVAGFCLVIAWFVLTMRESYELFAENSEPKSYGQIGLAGLAVFGAAWVWSLLTSIALIRKAKKTDEAAAKNPPPVLE